MTKYLRNWAILFDRWKIHRIESKVTVETTFFGCFFSLSVLDCFCKIIFICSAASRQVHSINFHHFPPGAQIRQSSCFSLSEFGVKWDWMKRCQRRAANWTFLRGFSLLHSNRMQWHRGFVFFFVQMHIIIPGCSGESVWSPESDWSLCRRSVTFELIKGVFRAAGLHLGPGINAALVVHAETSQSCDGLSLYQILQTDWTFPAVFTEHIRIVG